MKLRIFSIIGVLTGMGSIGLIIWNRLIRVRLPREIEGELWSMEFWIILYLLILFFLMFIYACNKLQKKLRGIPEGDGVIVRFVKRLEEKYPRLISYFEKKLQFIRTYILGGPLFLWNSYYSRYRENVLIVNLYHLGECIWELYFYEGCKNYRLRVVLTTIILGYLPKIMGVSIFLYEILIYKRIEYFYIIAPILLIPLIFNSYLRILFDICYYERIDIEKDIKLNGVKGEYPEESYVMVNKKPEVFTEEEFKSYVGEFATLLKIQRVIVEFFEMELVCGDIGKLIVNGILMLSFMFWWLAMV
jgi:hypothetical protein